MWKDAKCIILPTNKAMWPNCIWLGRITKKLRLDTSYNDNPKTIEPVDNSMLPQHLYIISLDEEIKEGDWCLWMSEIIEANPKHCHVAQKVIATTDSSLVFDNRFLKTVCGEVMEASHNKSLPQIPQQFIEEWIAEYNKE